MYKTELPSPFILTSNGEVHGNIEVVQPDGMVFLINTSDDFREAIADTPNAFQLSQLLESHLVGGNPVFLMYFTSVCGDFLRYDPEQSIVHGMMNSTEYHHIYFDWKKGLATIRNLEK